MLQCLEQLRAARREALAGQRFLAEQLQRPLVGQEHALLRVQHHDAGAHALQDQGVEGLEVGDLLGALAGQSLADLQAPSQSLDEKGCGEAQRSERTGLDVLAAGFGTADAQVEGQVDQAGGSDRGDEETDPPPQENIGDGDGDDQQVADAARRSSAKIEQSRQQDHVHQRQAEHWQVALGALHQHRDDDVEDQIEPGAVLKQLRIAHLQQIVVQVAADQQHQREANGQAVEVIQAKDAPPLVAEEGEVLSAHQRCCPARGEPGCSTSGHGPAGPGSAARARRIERSGPSAGCPAVAR